MSSRLPQVGSRRLHGKRAFPVLCLALVAACGQSASGPKASGSSCEQDSECAEGFCTYLGSGDISDAQCAAPCLDNGDCGEGLTCGLSHHVEGTYCLPPCVSDEMANAASSSTPFACVEGSYVSCEDVPEQTHCSACGCADGTFCTEEGTCETKVAAGEVCSTNAACLSENCSAARFSLDSDAPDPTGVCIEAPGTVCTTESACTCQPYDGELRCVAACGLANDCPRDAAYQCLGNLATHVGSCHIQCINSRGCPGGQTCALFDDAFSSFSACVPQ